MTKIISLKLTARWVMVGLLTSTVAIGIIESQSAHAARNSLENMVNFTQYPVVGSSVSVPPQVVLNVSRDHQLFFKAYNDYTDLDGDGVLETTYKHSIEYYGYFDPYKCYSYVANVFVPIADRPTKYCAASSGWSGNFMNWVTTSRMDAIRKLLYGGKRSTDTPTNTVLERAFIPRDGHAWAKYYDGSDINLLTPFDPTPAASVDVARANTKIGPYSVDTVATPGWNQAPWSAAPHTSTINFLLGGATYEIGDQVKIDPIEDPNLSDTYMVAGVVSVTATTVALRVDPGSILFQGARPAGNNAALIDNATNRYSNFRLTNLTNRGISFCNVTNSTASSQTDTNPPLIRVVRGNHALWAANEKWQCHWFAEKSNAQGTFYYSFRSNGNRAFESGIDSSAEFPRQDTAGRALGTGQSEGEYIMRVAACVDGFLGTERCKLYPSGNRKPVGLLQQYGDNGDLKFALLTPTWHNNVSGGVLRRAMGDMRVEVNTATDGTRITGVDGIVSALDKFKMYGLPAAISTSSYVGCTFQLFGIAPSPGTGAAAGGGGISGEGGGCSGWGNPFSELYIESLRYLAGGSATPTAGYQSGTEDGDLGLTSVTTWTDPVETAKYCSPLNIINFNASTSSYDFDINTSALSGGPGPVALTSSVGTMEGISGNIFIGETAAADDNLCSIKAFTSLGAVKGICPEAGALEGTYLMAGMAWWARTNKIRAAPVVPATDSQSLKVTTYGIQLATNTPKIEVPISGNRKITILPAYRLDRNSNGTGPFGGGALVDFKVISIDTVNKKGKFYANWEDSAQGGDFDQDMWGTIEYEVLNNGGSPLADDRIRITTDAVSASTLNGQGFGYIISGTNDDGPHFHSGILDFDYTDSTYPSIFVRGVPVSAAANPYINATGGCSNCRLSDPPTTAVYNITGVVNARVLNDPLWYAAKYGGFVDSNNNNRPDLVSEWDSKLVNGNPGSDGVPDTYFLVTNPGALEDSLARVFQAILSKTSSGTAAAVVANSSRGFGAVYQALFEARRSDSQAREVQWLGDLQGIWVDSAGLLREDDGDKRLENYTVDPVIQFFFDAGAQPPRARFKRLTNTNTVVPTETRFVPGPIGSDGLPTGTTLELESLGTLWNARKTLAAVPPAGLGVQRTYSGAASGNRHILTWIDANRDGNMLQSEIKPFEWSASGFTASNFGYLNSNDETEAQKLVNWTRGIEVAGLRNRTLDYTGSGPAQVQKLGDIVNSTPVAAGSPAEGFNLLYNDTTYSDFAAYYTPRRQMVYLGANDGMLHAFHGGFFDQRQLRFARSAGTATSQDLGTEIWSYVPGNILPHLRWMADRDYTHVFTVDGSPYVFDANVFTADTDHVSGWGTLVAVNFRTGGGTITTDTANNGLGVTSDNLTSKAATILLDVTNPEVAPKVLAEIPARQGWQVGRPTTVAFRVPTGTLNKWFLVVPSGPNSELNAGRVVSLSLIHI